MKIDHLQIENFRCFADQELFFDDRFSLLIGANATGKTAVLDAIAIALGAALISVPQATSASVTRRDARRIYRPTGETGHYADYFPVRIAAEGTFADMPLSWSRELMSEKSRTTRRNAETVQRAMQELMRRNQEGGDIVFPMIGYYGTGRLWLEQRLTYRRKSEPAKRDSRYVGYRNCLTPSSSARQMIAWIKRLALIEIQKGKSLNTLNGIYQAIANCVEGAIQASFDFDEDDIVLEFHGSNRFPLHLLSDGQRGMAATVADIAMRCSQLNPHLNERALRETPGVILIDEIDLHLHPRWQRGVVEQLSCTFPSIQFVATSHSPFIVQSMSQGGVINLDGVDLRPRSPENLSVEDVAEDIMGVEQPQRSKRFYDMLRVAEQYYAALEDTPVDADQATTQELRQKLDELEEPFTDNPAYVAFLRLQRNGRA